MFQWQFKIVFHTLNNMASVFRNFGKLLSLNALITTKLSSMRGFSRLNKPAITKTLFIPLK